MRHDEIWWDVKRHDVLCFLLYNVCKFDSTKKQPKCVKRIPPPNAAIPLVNPILRTSLLRQIWGYMLYIFFDCQFFFAWHLFQKIIFVLYIYIWCPKKTDIEKNPSASSQASAANADVFLSKTYCTSFPSCTHDCSSNSLEANVLDSENRKAWALYICIYINYINYKTVFIFYVFDILKLIYLIYI